VLTPDFAHGATEAERLATEVARQVRAGGDVGEAVREAFDNVERHLPEPLTAGSASVHRLPEHLIDTLAGASRSGREKEAAGD